MSDYRIYKKLHEAIETQEDYEKVKEIVSNPNWKQSFKNITLQTRPIPAPSYIDAWYELKGSPARYLHVERTIKDTGVVGFTLYQEVEEDEIADPELDIEGTYLPDEVEYIEQFGNVVKLDGLYNLGHRYLSVQEYTSIFEEAWATLVNK